MTAAQGMIEEFSLCTEGSLQLMESKKSAMMPQAAWVGEAHALLAAGGADELAPDKDGGSGADAALGQVLVPAHASAHHDLQPCQAGAVADLQATCSPRHQRQRMTASCFMGPGNAGGGRGLPGELWRSADSTRANGGVVITSMNENDFWLRTVLTQPRTSMVSPSLASPLSW